MRVKRGVTARAKHKKILKAAKGMQHNRTRSFRLAKQAVIRALQYSYRDRRNRRRDLRAAIHDRERLHIAELHDRPGEEATAGDRDDRAADGRPVRG